MLKKSKKIELLAPAKDKATAIAAINAGADAVYIGYSKFGARKSAGNSLDDIKEITEYADKFRVSVYVTLNTIYTDSEMPEVADIIYKLYEIGVSAIIIQDMGILEQKLPPVRLFASTQCNNDTLEKIRFLENTGFERVILPREFSLEEIKNITDNTNIDVETFIHGALCVSYSGQCYFSYVNGGRSANRGECAQPCRKKYSLMSADGQIIAKDKYLLSLKDFNLSEYIEDLILAGVTSFKIEGRLKDTAYVTNVVAFYRKKIDEILKKYNLLKSSSGKPEINFEPNLSKSFNRGFTNFNIDGKRKNICTMNYVKSLGEYLGKADKVYEKYFTVNGEAPNNGDGICFFNSENGDLTGSLVQKNDNGKIYLQNMTGIKKNISIYRNLDVRFEKELQKPIKRTIAVKANIVSERDKITLTYTDEDNITATCTENFSAELANNPEKAIYVIKNQISKTGDTEFFVTDVSVDASQIFFVPVSVLNDLRRKTVSALQIERNKNLQNKKRNSEIKITEYPYYELKYNANILNESAVNFYKKRGVLNFEYAAEKNKNIEFETVMTSKHCIKYSLGLCKKHFKNPQKYLEPYILIDNRYKKYILEFNCTQCKMYVKTSNHA